MLLFQFFDWEYHKLEVSSYYYYSYCCLYCLLLLICPVTTRADHGNWAPNRSCTNGYFTVWRFSNWQRSNKVWSNILDFSFHRLYYGECVEWGDLCCKSMLATQKSIRSFLAFLREPSGAASAIQLGSPHLLWSTCPCFAFFFSRLDDDVLNRGGERKTDVSRINK